MIKTVIFDLGGVYFTNGTNRAIKEISAQYAVSAQKVRYVLNGKLGTQYRIGKITASEFWKQAKKCWKIDASPRKLAHIWLKGYRPIKGTVEIIRRLRSAGYELIFLSDNVQERVDYLEQKYHFLHRFDGGIFSHIARVRKPSRKIYELVLKKASRPASQCMYIDDKPEFLKPAEKLGIKVVVFENHLQLAKALKNVGLKF